jgi:hypothetical protein
MDREELLRLARSGAEARLTQLRAEETAILRAFPDLRSHRTQNVNGGGSSAPRRRRRRKLSAEARKRISEAQKARWAKQRRKSKAPESK